LLAHDQQFTVVLLRSGTGELVGIEALLRDVTKRFDQMRTIKRQLAAAATGLGHTLNNGPHQTQNKGIEARSYPNLEQCRTYWELKGSVIRSFVNLEERMRIRLAIFWLAISTSFALAQNQQTPPQSPAPPSATSQGEPTGSAVIPENTGKQQPQGKTGPLETKGKGASPENPQGGTPEGMQVHPTRPK
jgi:hypothetical protein